MCFFFTAYLFFKKKIKNIAAFVMLELMVAWDKMAAMQRASKSTRIYYMYLFIIQVVLEYHASGRYVWLVRADGADEASFIPYYFTL